MSSYNKINGVYASHNKWLLTDVVRGEWDYKGLVVTDWFGGKDGAAMIAAGNNLIMPGTTTYKRAIIRAIEKGKLSMDELDASVRRVLELILKSPRFNKYAYSDAPDLKSHAEFVRNADTECMVLLENKEVLPLAKSVKNIAVYGVGSYDYIIGGTGSGDVNEAYTVSLAEGLANAGYKLNIELKDAYTKHIKKHYEPKPQVTDNKEGLLDGSAELAKFLPQPRPAELLYSANELKVQAKQADVAIITISRVAGEFADRRLKGDFELSDEEQNLIKNVSDAFHAKGKKIVVVLNVGGVVETSSWKSIPDAVLLAWQGGQEAGNSIADILSGKFSPSGKLPMTFPIRFEDAGSSANFPVDYTPANQMELAMGRSNVKPEKYIRNVDFTNYDEGIYVGYRWFDTKNINVSYPFGYGLSYTKFEYSDAKISVADGNYTVVCTVRNAGNTAGKEVVQLYVSAPGNTMDKPAKELKAFAKTQNLQPNESQTVELKITREQLASFDENAKRWIVESGEYKVLIGTSSQDIKQTVNLKL
jgi:beta-glucosidase